MTNNKMRWIVLLVLTLHSAVEAATYFVSNTGSDQSEVEARRLHDQLCRRDRHDVVGAGQRICPADADRSSLREVGAQLAAGSRSALENDYLETALVADLPIPADPHRTGCVTASPPPLLPAP